MTSGEVLGLELVWIDVKEIVVGGGGILSFILIHHNEGLIWTVDWMKLREMFGKFRHVVLVEVIVWLGIRWMVRGRKQFCLSCVGVG